MPRKGEYQKLVKKYMPLLTKRGLDSEATARADSERRKGYNARVVKEKLSNRPARWLVYTR